MRGDLHSHTIYSDGVLTVEELISRAKIKGLSVFSITDHDCFDGAIIAQKYNTKDFRIVYGVEVSTKSNSESIHILAYFFKPITDGILYDYLLKQKENRKDRAYKMISLLEEHFGFVLDDSFIKKTNSITRANIAREIVKQGYAKDIGEVFSKMIGPNNPCYLHSTHLQTKDAIEMIKASNGMPVLAHPCLYNKNDIEELIKLGVRGIEAVYPNGRDKETKYRDLAKKYNLLITGGSDFHRLNDTKHGDVADATIQGKELETFLKVLDNEY